MDTKKKPGRPGKDQGRTRSAGREAQACRDDQVLNDCSVEHLGTTGRRPGPAEDVLLRDRSSGPIRTATAAWKYTRSFDNDSMSTLISLCAEASDRIEKLEKQDAAQ